MYKSSRRNCMLERRNERERENEGEKGKRATVRETQVETEREQENLVSSEAPQTMQHVTTRECH